jgi:hypothetical protein
MPRLTRRLEDLDHRDPMFGDERFLCACGVRPPDVRDELRVLDR